MYGNALMKKLSGKEAKESFSVELSSKRYKIAISSINGAPKTHQKTSVKRTQRHKDNSG
jgi:hypothetical protein